MKGAHVMAAQGETVVVSGPDIPAAPDPEVLQGAEADAEASWCRRKGWVRVPLPQFPARPTMLHLIPSWAAVYVDAGTWPRATHAYVEPTVRALCSPDASDRLGNATLFGRMSGPDDPLLRAVHSAWRVGGIGPAEVVLRALTL